MILKAKFPVNMIQTHTHTHTHTHTDSTVTSNNSPTVYKN